jgi:hypothetical protein
MHRVPRGKGVSAECSAWQLCGLSDGAGSSSVSRLPLWCQPAHCTCPLAQGLLQHLSCSTWVI